MAGTNAAATRRFPAPCVPGARHACSRQGGTQSAAGDALVGAGRRRGHHPGRGGDELPQLQGRRPAIPRRQRRRRSIARRSKSFETLRSAHVAEHQRLFRRVTLDLGTDADARAARPTSGIARFAERSADPQLAALVLPVRPLPADLQLAPGQPAGQPAGRLERSGQAAVGQQVHDQHQHRDELLAGGVHEPRRSWSSR